MALYSLLSCAKSPNNGPDIWRQTARLPVCRATQKEEKHTMFLKTTADIKPASSCACFSQLSRAKRKLVLEAEKNGFQAFDCQPFSITLEKPGHHGLRLFNDGNSCDLLLLRTRVTNKNIRTLKALRAHLGLPPE
jgi:hypothetical protein